MNKMVSKLWRLCTLLLVALPLLTACGEADHDIVLVNPFVGADGDNFQDLIDAFNATNPEFPVRNVAMEQDAMYASISTAFPTGTGIPDLVIVHAERIQNFVQNEMLVSWDDLLIDFPEFRAENYLTSAWEIGEINGNRYGIPLDIHTWILYYNKDMMAHYDVLHVLDDSIVTFDEILEIGAVMEAAGSDHATIGLTWMWPNFLSVYRQMGGNITEDGIHPTLYNETAIAAFELLHGLYTSGFSNENGEDASQLFQTGQLMFIPEGIWYLNTANTIDSFEWGVTHKPQYTVDHLVNWSSSHQFVMFETEERTDEKATAIIAFIDWVRENSIDWARAGQNPAALAILESSEFQTMPQAFLLQSDEARDSLVIFEYLYNGFVSDEINRIGFDIVFGHLDVHEGLQSAQQAVEDMIAQDRASESS